MRVLLLLSMAGLALAATVGMRGAPPRDPLKQEIDRWLAVVATNKSTAEYWVQAKQVSQAMLEGAQQAIGQGRRLLAIRRLAAARENLAAALYVQEIPAAKLSDQAGLDAEWKRMAAVLAGDTKPPGSNALSEVRPAALRALGEAALSQVHVYYDASLDYGRNTTPDSGFYYLGVAKAQRDFVALCRDLSSPPGTVRAPLIRSISQEIDALQSELLALYRPPASLERHRDFILASATLKEARELDAAGLRFGALLRYLQAAERLAPVRVPSGVPNEASLSNDLRALEERLAASGVDNTIAQLFIEEGEADLSTSGPAKGATAAEVVREVIPRYLAALAPPKPALPRPAPVLRVTLVRWPYT